MGRRKKRRTGGRRSSDKSLAAALVLVQKRAAGAPDPFAGVPPQLFAAFLYSTDADGRGFGPAHDGHIRVHHTRTLAGNCAVGPEEPLEQRLIRWASLDRDEASLLRQLFVDPNHDSAALQLGVSLRTVRRWDATIRAKLLGAGLLDMLPE